MALQQTVNQIYIVINDANVVKHILICLCKACNAKRGVSQRLLACKVPVASHLCCSYVNITKLSPCLVNSCVSSTYLETQVITDTNLMSLFFSWVLSPLHVRGTLWEGICVQVILFWRQCGGSSRSRSLVSGQAHIAKRLACEETDVISGWSFHRHCFPL